MQIDYEQIVREVSWQTKDGLVDWSNTEHIDILRKTLREMNVDNTLIDEAIQVLRENRKK